jgi:hypothetical protein
LRQSSLAIETSETKLKVCDFPSLFLFLSAPAAALNHVDGEDFATARAKHKQKHFR